MNLVFWIHGIQGDGFGEKQVRQCMTAVDSMLPKGEYSHFLFNWDSVVGDRQAQMWELLKDYGGWLPKLVTKQMIFLGTDMWWDLQSKRNSQPGDTHHEIQRRLADLVSEMEKKYSQMGYPTTFNFVCHSWGNQVGLSYAIERPDRLVRRFISLGSPLLYGSGGYTDWGNPDLLENIEHWTNLWCENDPISKPMGLNPGPHRFKWQQKVNDIRVPYFWPLPLKAHCHYWGSSRVRKLIADALV